MKKKWGEEKRCKGKKREWRERTRLFHFLPIVFPFPPSREEKGEGKKGEGGASGGVAGAGDEANAITRPP